MCMAEMHRQEAECSVVMLGVVKRHLMACNESIVVTCSRLINNQLSEEVVATESDRQELLIFMSLLI